MLPLLCISTHSFLLRVPQQLSACTVPACTSMHVSNGLEQRVSLFLWGIDRLALSLHSRCACDSNAKDQTVIPTVAIVA